MLLRQNLRRFALALAVTLGASAGLAALAPASPAEARDSRKEREHPIYNARQAWFMVDRDQNGRISSKEWKWAEKNGYDRLNGVPKRHLTRAEYQRYLDAYLVRRDAENQRRWQRDSHVRHNERDRQANQAPWYAPTKGGFPGNQRGGHRAN